MIMRSLRVSPTEPEIRAFLRAKNGVLSFADFLDCMHAQQRRERPAEEVRRALAASDSRRRGAIPVKELRHLLSGWGEKLSAREGNLNLNFIAGPQQLLRDFTLGLIFLLGLNLAFVSFFSIYDSRSV